MAAIGAFFVGRSREFERLRSLLAGEFPRSVIVTGLGGIGKTSFVQMFAHAAAELFPDGIEFLSAPLHETRATQRIELPDHIASRFLLVIDDLDRVSWEAQSQLMTRLDEAHFRHPNLRSVVISRLQLSRMSSEHVVLGGLDEREFYLLASKVAEETGARLQLRELERLQEISHGHPAIARLALEELRSGRSDAISEITGHLRAFQVNGLVGPDGRPLSGGSERQVIVEVSAANDEIFKLLKTNPEVTRSLPPRKFEELVAEMLAKMGYEITLTPEQKDGGFDIYAARKEGLGQFLYLVECKRYVPPNKVGVEIVRSLHGVLQAERATAGAIVTTSFFTSGAKEYQQRIEHQMQLHDYITLQTWIKGFPLTRH
ncbi:restriction endonuclease [Bradyrhizobium sp. I1.7.5]|uniref:restriction endonuclease n=1 Tax=Bradyrhizobium sp. I1.7.5 TaxID=3156363 RepID=UPI0033944198